MKKSFTDQLGRLIEIQLPPKRIISLVPSQTELLFDLGLDDEVIGVTKFCIHPTEKTKRKQKIGGTKKLDMEMIRRLKPDLIIGNKEENNRSDIELLQTEFPVWMSDIQTLKQATEMIFKLGDILDRDPEANYLNHLINAGFKDLHILAQSNVRSMRVAYAIWRDPYMFAGHDTFINDVLGYAGLTNVVKQDRYPELSLEEISVLKPELILLSSEPYPFKEKHILEIKAIIPNVEVLLVDGELFSWYGSRLLKSVGYLFDLRAQLGLS
jgi:ABC-type Fe3+-hydroxamate transport system substrate-binding protein